MQFFSDIKQNQDIVDKMKNMRIKKPIVMPVLGMGVITLAVISYFTELPVSELFLWIDRFFSSVFIVIYTLLVVLGIYAIVQLKHPQYVNYWQEVGLQAGNAIATLALTFTLLGISLGIGTLSEQPLNPENIQSIVSGLTQQFSMAFMTTVIGLPTATLLRALVSIKYQQIIIKSNDKKN